jgi:hypothetical protein
VLLASASWSAVDTSVWLLLPACAARRSASTFS